MRHADSNLDLGLLATRTDGSHVALCGGDPQKLIRDGALSGYDLVNKTVVRWLPRVFFFIIP